MRFLLLFLLFLLTIYLYFLEPFIREKGIYIDLDINLKKRTIKNLVLNLNNVFGKNVYIYVRKIKLSQKTIYFSDGKVIIVNLKKQTKKKESLKV